MDNVKSRNAVKNFGHRNGANVLERSTWFSQRDKHSDDELITHRGPTELTIHDVFDHASDATPTARIDEEGEEMISRHLTHSRGRAGGSFPNNPTEPCLINDYLGNIVRQGW
jgi:hypothetical protein